MKYYTFKFADGFETTVRGLSKSEMARLVATHGRLVGKKIAC